MKVIFYQRLKELREEKEMFTKDLAKIVGHDASLITKWEKGVHRPTYEVLMVLALFFDVSIDYLIGLEDEFGNKIKL